MLFEQRFGICQEGEYASRRGMGTGDHCRSCVVCRLRVRVHLTSARSLALGFFRNSAQGLLCPVFPSQFPTNPSQQMSLLAVSRRAAFRAAPRSTRSVVVDAAPKEWAAKREAVIHHAKGA